MFQTSFPLSAQVVESGPGQPPVVELARLDAVGFARLEVLRESEDLFARCPRLTTIGDRRPGSASWQDELLRGTLYGLDRSPGFQANADHVPGVPIVLARAAQRPWALYQLKHGELRDGLMGLVEGNDLKWYQKDGTAVCSSELARFLLDQVVGGPNAGATPILGEQLLAQLAPGAIMLPNPDRTRPARALVGPVFVDTTTSATGATSDHVVFRHPISGCETYFCPGLTDLELATYAQFRHSGMDQVQAKSAARLISV